MRVAGSILAHGLGRRAKGAVAAILARPGLLSLLAAGIPTLGATAWLVDAVRTDIAAGLTGGAVTRSPATPVSTGSAAIAPDPASDIRRNYFPASGSVIWHEDAYTAVELTEFSYGGFADLSAELALADSGRGYNHVLRFHRAGRHGSRLLLSVHLAEGGRARVDLPLGAYRVELVSRPVDADYETAFGPHIRGRLVGNVRLTRPSSAYRLGPMLVLTDRRRATFIRGVRAARPL